MNATVYAYSLKKDGETNLAKHFKVKEFACKDGSDTVFVASLLPVILEAIRGIVGVPLTITSGFRTEQHNEEVGGATCSQHLYGAAADVRATGCTPERLAEVARYIMPNFGGVGVYSWGIHVDVRMDKADWKG